MRRMYLFIGAVFLLLLSLAFISLGSNRVKGEAGEERSTYTIPWSVIGSGGMGGSAGGYTINSTLGQPVAGVADAGGYHLTSGFWTEIIESIEEFFNFLPLIIR